jgi:hypothetical protein
MDKTYASTEEDKGKEKQSKGKKEKIGKRESDIRSPRMDEGY